ncbi:MAG: FRG domain-containing protein [candidate division Zixibacteria bacterium]|nr:FRG domain-containing protein [candidate division Zixibacteria bacterium]
MATIDSETVNSGSLDVRTSYPPGTNRPSDQPCDLCSLLAWLLQHHTDGFVYRGQTRIWPGPLVPSIHRGCVASEPTVGFAPHHRLRSVGCQFHELTPKPPGREQPISAKRMEFMRYLIQLFGYPFGNILSQQCGLTSEGLDVTHDPMVAAFFAIFDFQLNEFVEEGTGVIYRIPIDVDETFQNDISKTSFYNTSSCVSAIASLLRLNRCATWEEAAKSFLDYCVEFNASDPSQPARKRPLDKLALPLNELILSRVVQQRAGLHFPDMVLPRFYKALNIPPPDGKADWDGPVLIEDVATRQGVDCFSFEHSPKNRFKVLRSPQVLFPSEDPFKAMLKIFASRLPRFVFATELGSDGMVHPELIE